MSQQVLIETILEVISKGGWVMIPIFVVGWLAWYLLFERSWVVWRAFRNLAELDQVALRQQANGTEAIQHALELWMHERNNQLEQHLRTISTLAAAAPLLGLLGTVSGMVHTFETITSYGFGNPVLLAEGISEALLTTQAGLVVAFPIVIFHNFLFHRIERFKSVAHAESLRYLVPSKESTI